MTDSGTEPGYLKEAAAELRKARGLPPCYHGTRPEPGREQPS